jgi:ElaB/YqjD/DUF883 family membrane-anchored ribosome-binding protein
MSSMDPYTPGNPTGLEDRPHGSGDIRSKASDLASQAKEKVSNTASQLANKASDYGRTAIDKVDRGRTSAASALDSTAEGLRSGAHRVTSFGEVAADRLVGTANYLREHDARRMAGDLESVIRRNPAPSLLVAAAFGFFLGAALRRDS